MTNPETHAGWLPEQVTLLSGDHVLQTPCATGSWLLNLADDQLTRVGVDPIPLNLQHARTAAAQRQVRAAFVAGNPTSIPFADGCFNLILTCGALEHAIHPQNTLTELARLLAPNGAIVWVALDSERAKAVESISENAPQPLVAAPLRGWTLDQLHALCSALGLQIVAEQPPPDGPWAVISFA